MEIFPARVRPARWEKLLVCTDGSAEGQNAVAITLELARAWATALMGSTTEKVIGNTPCPVLVVK